VSLRINILLTRVFFFLTGAAVPNEQNDSLMGPWPSWRWIQEHKIVLESQIVLE
jgi:hypothetical protein